MSSIPDLVITNESNPAKLPANYASWLDPTVPLPTDVRFYWLEWNWKDVQNRTVFGIIALLIGLGTAYVTIKLSGFLDSLGNNSLTATKLNGYVLSVPGAIAPIGILFGLISLNSARNTIGIVRARRSGKIYRFGLFISPEAVLIQEEGNYGFFGNKRIIKSDRLLSGTTSLECKADTETKDKSGDTEAEEKLTRRYLPDKLEALSLDEIFDLV